MRFLVASAGVVGGLCWLVAPWVGPLGVVGAVLLGVAVVGAGAGLVSSGATWLRWIVAVCFLALVASVLGVLRDTLDDQVVLLAGGFVALAIGGAALSRPAPSRGTHAR